MYVDGNNDLPAACGQGARRDPPRTTSSFAPIFGGSVNNQFTARGQAGPEHISSPT